MRRYLLAVAFLLSMLPLAAQEGKARLLIAEAHPWLTQDVKFCAFTYELENKTSHFWDMAEKKLIDLPKINDSPNAVFSPSLTADGKLICFAALSRPMGPA